MVGPGVGELQLPTFEQHYGDIDTAIPRRDDARAHAVEITRVKFRQVKLRFAVNGGSRPGTHPGVRLTKLDDAFGLRIGPLRRFPSPQAEKIVVMCHQKIEVSVVIEDRRRILGSGHPVAVVLEVVPVVRTHQIDGFARSVGKVSRVGLQDAQRTCGRMCLRNHT